MCSGGVTLSTDAPKNTIASVAPSMTSPQKPGASSAADCRWRWPPASSRRTDRSTPTSCPPSRAPAP